MATALFVVFCNYACSSRYVKIQLFQTGILTLFVRTDTHDGENKSSIARVRNL